MITETFAKRDIDPVATPAVLVNKHGPFSWGGTVQTALENALVLEEVSHMALLTKQMSSSVNVAPRHLMDKHYFRKYGTNAYYGQK